LQLFWKFSKKTKATTLHLHQPTANSWQWFNTVHIEMLNAMSTTTPAAAGIAIFSLVAVGGAVLGTEK
jgi:hypothetical protein